MLPHNTCVLEEVSNSTKLSIVRLIPPICIVDNSDENQDGWNKRFCIREYRFNLVEYYYGFKVLCIAFFGRLCNHLYITFLLSLVCISESVVVKYRSGLHIWLQVL